MSAQLELLGNYLSHGIERVPKARIIHATAILPREGRPREVFDQP